MKISASIYSNPNEDLLVLAKKLDLFFIDYFHIDCLDDLSVFDDIQLLKKNSKTPIDLHIITKDPQPFYDEIISNQVEIVAFQHENLEKPLILPSGITSQVGIAFTSETDIEEFEQYKDICSFVLLMTTTPGKSGGTFDKSTFERIRQFKKLYPQKRIHVDGGVNEEVSFILRSLGVYCAISGSYLVKSTNIPNALFNLRTQNFLSEYQIRDFMLYPSELPILQSNEATDVKSILIAINESKMGFCLIVDEDMRFVGIVTDGDIRRAILENFDNLNSLRSEELINRFPITVLESIRVKDMLEMVTSRMRQLTFLPVVDSTGHLVGATYFNNLIKGEL